MKKQIVVERDLMQLDYVYFLTEQVGKKFHPEFRPTLTKGNVGTWSIRREIHE